MINTVYALTAISAMGKTENTVAGGARITGEGRSGSVQVRRGFSN